MVLDSDFGIKSFLTFVFSIILFLTSCVSDDDPENGSEPESSQDGFEESIVESDGQFPHPKEATSWNTQMIVMTNPLPSPEKLQACVDQMNAVASSAQSSEGMILAQKQAFYEVRQNKEVYHWCFYHSMMMLDKALLDDHMNTSYLEKNNLFLKRIKSLWILAKGLDQSDGSDKYFKYLRYRYLELSNSIFGRNIDSFGSPLEEKNNIKKYSSDNPDGKSIGKPAEAVDPDL